VGFYMPYGHDGRLAAEIIGQMRGS
jgi:hypothetical protein